MMYCWQYSRYLLVRAGNAYLPTYFVGFNSQLRKQTQLISCVRGDVKAGVDHVCFLLAVDIGL